MKFSNKDLVQLTLVIPLSIQLYGHNPLICYLGLLVMLAGMFNGIADQINFDHVDNYNDDSIFPFILKGWILKWFEGDFKQYVRDRWWIHAIFMDGWHLFKNLWVGTFIFNVIFALIIVIDEWWWGLILPYYYICFAYLWMQGKGSMHTKIASAKFWGF